RAISVGVCTEICRFSSVDPRSVSERTRSPRPLLPSHAEMRTSCEGGRVWRSARWGDLSWSEHGVYSWSSCRAMAQATRATSSTDRASDYGSEGWGVESLVAHRRGSPSPDRMTGGGLFSSPWTHHHD